MDEIPRFDLVIFGLVRIHVAFALSTASATKITRPYMAELHEVRGKDRDLLYEEPRQRK